MAGLFLRDLWYNKICASILIPNKLRVRLYTCGGGQLHRGVSIFPHCFLESANLEIGEDTFVNYECWFNTAEK